MDASKYYQVAISLLPGIGNLLARQLISYCGSAEKVFSTTKHKLMQIPGIGHKTAETILRHANLKRAEELVRQCQSQDIKILHFTDLDYPCRLNGLYDAPAILFYKGSASLNPSKAVSIVGTRRVTAYGRATTERIVSELKVHNATIISGLAFGVDHLAHCEALKLGLPTIGVIAGGLKHIYPALHQKTAERMCHRGGILTEYEPDITPEAHFFPERNRLIAGLSDAVIVVEAARKGGALITAEYANNYHREVLAVPGQVGQHFSEGCNHLIKVHKANIYTSISDLEYLLNWEEKLKDESRAADSFSELSIPEKKLVKLLQQHTEGLLIDELSWKSQIPVHQIASHLLNLEFRDIVKALPGKKFRLKH